MKRIVLAVVVVGLVAFGYRYYSSSIAPAKCYRAFAEEILHRRYEEAAHFAVGLSAADLSRQGTQEKIGAGPPMFQTLFPSRFDIKSESRSSDGTVTIDAVQTVLFNPVGVESAVRPAMYARMNQTVSLKNDAGTWKVLSFKNEFDTMDTLRAR